MNEISYITDNQGIRTHMLIPLNDHTKNIQSYIHDLQKIIEIELLNNNKIGANKSQLTTKSKYKKTFLEIAMEQDFEAPADWSSRVDEYLYGNIK